MKAVLYCVSALLAINVPLVFFHPTPPWVVAVLYAVAAADAFVEARRV